MNKNSEIKDTLKEYLDESPYTQEEKENLEITIQGILESEVCGITLCYLCHRIIHFGRIKS